MKITFFKQGHQGFGGRFENTTSPTTDGTRYQLTLPTDPNRAYPSNPITFGSSEQMFHFLKVVDYVNDKLNTPGLLTPAARAGLMWYADNLCQRIAASNGRAFMPTVQAARGGIDNWEAILTEFANNIFHDGNLHLLMLELQRQLPSSQSRLDYAWFAVAGAGKSPNDVQNNYRRMVKALELKMAGDAKFQQDMITCLTQGIFPAEYSRFDKTWATGPDGKGEGLLGPAMLEAARNFVLINSTPISIHQDFQGVNFQQLWGQIAQCCKSSGMTLYHDDVDRIVGRNYGQVLDVPGFISQPGHSMARLAALPQAQQQGLPALPHGMTPQQWAALPALPPNLPASALPQLQPAQGQANPPAPVAVLPPARPAAVILINGGNLEFTFSSDLTGNKQRFITTLMQHGQMDQRTATTIADHIIQQIPADPLNPTNTRFRINPECLIRDPANQIIGIRFDPRVSQMYSSGFDGVGVAFSSWMQAVSGIEYNQALFDYNVPNAEINFTPQFVNTLVAAAPPQAPVAQQVVAAPQPPIASPSNISQVQPPPQMVSQEVLDDAMRQRQEAARSAAHHIRSLADQRFTTRQFEAYWEAHRDEFPAGFMPRRSGMPEGWTPRDTAWVAPRR